MLTTWQKREIWLCGAVLALFALAVFGPALMQPAHPHNFADRRAWGHLPCAMDVLSNLPFALWGAAGLASLAKLLPAGGTRTAGRQELAQRVWAAVFFGGLLVTAFASAWYHHQSNEAGLVVDRLGMVVAFAGLMGLAAAGRVSARAGWWLGGAVLLLGPVTVAVWATSGNIGPWAVLQFGGMALVLVLGLARSQPLATSWGVRWGWVIAVYSLAKLLELADHEIYALTAEVVSGHTLKHLVASLAAWPVLAALHNQGRIERLQRLLRAQKIIKTGVMHAC